MDIPALPPNPFPDLVVEPYRDRRTWSSEMRWMYSIGELEIGVFDPFGGWSVRDYESDRVVVLYPTTPILCTQVVVSGPGADPPIVCLPRPDSGSRGTSKNTDGRLSPIAVASEKLDQWRQQEVGTEQEPLAASAALLWEDGTQFALQNLPIQQEDLGDRSLQFIRNFLGRKLFIHLREVAGFAPTPDRFFGRGWSATAFGARKLYLAEVLSNPEARLHAMHILGRCEY